VYWYETFTETYVKSKKSWKKKKDYSVIPENLNLDGYKENSRSELDIQGDESLAKYFLSIQILNYVRS
jgi:hypothetical protein